MLSGDSKFPSSGVFNDGHAEIYARGLRVVLALEVVEASRRRNRPSETFRERAPRWTPRKMVPRDIYAGGHGTGGGCFELLKDRVAKVLSSFNLSLQEFK